MPDDHQNISPGAPHHQEMASWMLKDCPGKYEWGRVAVSEPGPDEVKVRVVASALNHLDLWVAQGLPKPPLPHVPGSDVAGEVVAIGENVSTSAVGDEVVINPGISPVHEIIALGNDSPMGNGFMVYGEHCWGGHAEYAIAPARNVVRRPASRTWEEAAAFPLAYLTAYRMLRRGRLRAGESILIVGIGSGVSMAALALAKHMGAGTISVTSRSAKKRAEAEVMGADVTVDSLDPSWPVKVDLVLDSVGPATWQGSVRALKQGGRLVTCGGTSGASVELQLPRLFFQQYEIIGSSMGSYQEFEQLVALIESGLPVQIDSVMKLADYPSALARLERGEQLGKIVLTH